MHNLVKIPVKTCNKALPFLHVGLYKTLKIKISRCEYVTQLPPSLLSPTKHFFASTFWYEVIRDYLVICKKNVK